MNNKLLLASLLFLFSMQSCLISRGPQHELRNMNTQEVYEMRTVRVPTLLARPVVKAYLKSEDYPKEMRSYISRIKAVRVTMAFTRPGFDINAFRAIANKAPYQNWLSVNAYGNMVHINAEEKNNSIRRINIVVAGKDNALVYALIKCKLSPDDLSRFINIVMSDEQHLKHLMDEMNGRSKKEI